MKKGKWLLLGGIGASLIPVFLRKIVRAAPRSVDIAPGEDVEIEVDVKNTGTESHAFGVKGYPEADFDGIACDDTSTINPDKEGITYRTYTAQSDAAGYYDVEGKVYEETGCSGDVLDTDSESNLIHVVNANITETKFRYGWNGNHSDWYTLPSDWMIGIDYDTWENIDLKISFKNISDKSHTFWVGCTLTRESGDGFRCVDLEPKSVTVDAGKEGTAEWTNLKEGCLCPDGGPASTYIFTDPGDTHDYYNMKVAVWKEEEYDSSKCFNSALKGKLDGKEYTARNANYLIDVY